METNTHAFFGNQHHIVAVVAFTRAATREFHIDQIIARFNADGDDATLADVGKIAQGRFLHGALLRGKE